MRRPRTITVGHGPHVFFSITWPAGKTGKSSQEQVFWHLAPTASTENLSLETCPNLWGQTIHPPTPPSQALDGVVMVELASFEGAGVRHSRRQHECGHFSWHRYGDGPEISHPYNINNIIRLQIDRLNWRSGPGAADQTTNCLAFQPAHVPKRNGPAQILIYKVSTTMTTFTVSRIKSHHKEVLIPYITIPDLSNLGCWLDCATWWASCKINCYLVPARDVLSHIDPVQLL